MKVDFTEILKSILPITILIVIGYFVYKNFLTSIMEAVGGKTISELKKDFETTKEGVASPISTIKGLWQYWFYTPMTNAEMRSEAEKQLAQKNLW